MLGVRLSKASACLCLPVVGSGNRTLSDAYRAAHYYLVHVSARVSQFLKLGLQVSQTT